MQLKGAWVRCRGFPCQPSERNRGPGQVPGLMPRGDQLMYVMHPSSKLRLVQTGARHVTGAALIEQTNQFNCNRLITRTTASIELQRRYRYQ